MFSNYIMVKNNIDELVIVVKDTNYAGAFCLDSLSIEGDEYFHERLALHISVEELKKLRKGIDYLLEHYQDKNPKLESIDLTT